MNMCVAPMRMLFDNEWNDSDEYIWKVMKWFCVHENVHTCVSINGNNNNSNVCGVSVCFVILWIEPNREWSAWLKIGSESVDTCIVHAMTNLNSQTNFFYRVASVRGCNVFTTKMLKLIQSLKTMCRLVDGSSAAAFENQNADKCINGWKNKIEKKTHVVKLQCEHCGFYEFKSKAVYDIVLHCVTSQLMGKCVSESASLIY